MKWNDMTWHDMTCHDMTWNIMWWLKRDMTDENGDMWWQKLSHSCVKNNTSIKSPRANGFNISDVKPFNIIEFNPLCEFSHRVDDVESCWFNVSFLCEKQCWIRLADTCQHLHVEGTPNWLHNSTTFNVIHRIKSLQQVKLNNVIRCWIEVFYLFGHLV